MLKRNELEFTELFTATPHVFICDSHPLASKKSITMDDLQDYPYLTYEQGEYNSQYFSEDDMIPAPAQGTLALELRADNAKLMAKLDALSDEKTNLCAGIEREFLKRIGGNCHLPVAAYCDIVSEKDRGNDSNKK